MFLATVLVLAAPAAILAQDQAPSRLVRADISGTAGWVSANKHDLTYDDWRSQGEASLAFGWYWTDHHETEIEVGATTEASVYASVPVPLPGQPPAYVSTFSTFSTRRIAVIQHYQFRRNEWVHPFVGAGLDIVHERQARRDDPVFWYDPIARQTRMVRDRVDYAPSSNVTARAVLNAGVKAYLTRKVFSLTDLRVSVSRDRAEDVQWRFGLGVDF
jgi:hypothetical protein